MPCVKSTDHTSSSRAEQPTGFWKKRAGLVIRSRLLRAVVTTLKSRMWSMTNDPVSCKKIIFGVLPCLSYPKTHTIPISTLLLHYWLGVFLHDSSSYCASFFYVYLGGADSFISLTVQCICSSYYATLPPTRAICLPKNQDTCCVNWWWFTNDSLQQTWFSWCSLYSRSNDWRRRSNTLRWQLQVWWGGWTILRRVLGGSKLRHYQLWQLWSFHAHGLPMCHPWGMDWRTLLGKHFKRHSPL